MIAPYILFIVSIILMATILFGTEKSKIMNLQQEIRLKTAFVLVVIGTILLYFLR